MWQWVILAEFAAVGVLIAATGIVGLYWCLSPDEATRSLSDTLERQICDVLAACEFGEEEERNG